MTAPNRATQLSLRYFEPKIRLKDEVSFTYVAQVVLTQIYFKAKTGNDQLQYRVYKHRQEIFVAKNQSNIRNLLTSSYYILNIYAFPSGKKPYMLIVVVLYVCTYI